MAESTAEPSGSAARRETVIAARRALLEQRLRGETSARAADVAIPRRSPGEPPVLSAGQQRLWFLHQLDPDSAAYNMYQAVRLDGPLDHVALERSLHELVNRHQVLRTAFERVDGRPIAVIRDEPRFSVAVVDLRGAPDAERERLAGELVIEEVRRPFGLAAGPLLRGKLLQLGQADHVLVVTMHHIVADEWSLDVFWRELAAIYRRVVAGQPPALPELPLQYADYACWQQARGQAPEVARQLEYWRSALAEEPAELQLPATRPRPPRPSFRGALETHPLPPELSADLLRLSRREGVTPFVLLLTAWQVLLHRYSGETNIVVGTPVSSRTRTELEGLIGFFINTLVLRADLAGDPPFRDAVRSTRDVLLEAFANQEVPFESLVAELKPERRLSRNPLFQVMFVLQNESRVDSPAPEITVRPFAVDARTAKFDLTLFVRDAAGRLELTIEYATDLFDRATVTRMLGHFEVLLAGIATDPTRRLSDLPLLTLAERHQLLEWSGSAPELPPASQCAHQLFETQAELAPDALALLYEGEAMTYGELNRRADALALGLRALGVTEGACVGLCLERSPDVLVGILGVLKAGAAYVPLDPGYPDARLSFILHDTGALVVLTQQHLVLRLRSTGARVVAIDGQDWSSRTGSPAAPAATADSLAYVIHTSGSTGRPKGVAVTHRNLVHSTAARLRHYGGRPERFLLLPSFGFDSSVAGIFWTLCSGGTLVLPRQALEQDVRALIELIDRQHVSHTLCLPSLYALILEAADADRLGSLATVIVAGEACPAGLAQHHYARLPHTDLHNEYGPTEATVWTTVYRVPRDFAGDRVPIGRPIAGARVHVLDRYGQPVPVGVAGELYIGGAGLASGYLNRPEETAQRFLPDPFSRDPGARLYRSGDRVRWRFDGTLEFLGRTDQQVKIRGFRIEPDEITAVLGQHPSVRESVVVAPSGSAVSELSADADPLEVDEIAALLGALDPDEAEQILAEVEAMPAAQSGAR